MFSERGVISQTKGSIFSPAWLPALCLSPAATRLGQPSGPPRAPCPAKLPQITLHPQQPSTLNLLPRTTARPVCAEAHPSLRLQSTSSGRQRGARSLQGMDSSPRPLTSDRSREGPDPGEGRLVVKRTLGQGCLGRRQLQEDNLGWPLTSLSQCPHRR